jgi:anti-sigma factor RsiW
MNGHVSEWLAAYYDGELHGPRQQHVEEHLGSCPVCQAELESLRKLSMLLQEAPTAEGQLAAQRFRAQVMLRLPPTILQPGWQQTLKVGWQLAPFGAVLAWVFGQAAWLVASMVPVLKLPLSLSRAGMLGSGLNLASANPGWTRVESIIQLGLLNLAFSALVALFLCGWLASWWVVRRRSQDGKDLLAS